MKVKEGGGGSGKWTVAEQLLVGVRRAGDGLLAGVEYRAMQWRIVYRRCGLHDYDTAAYMTEI